MALSIEVHGEYYFVFFFNIIGIVRNNFSSKLLSTPSSVIIFDDKYTSHINPGTRFVNFFPYTLNKRPRAMVIRDRRIRSGRRLFSRRSVIRLFEKKKMFGG